MRSCCVGPSGRSRRRVGKNLTGMQYCFRNVKEVYIYIIFRKESYFLVEERKHVRRVIGEDPTNEQRAGFCPNPTERKMPVFSGCFIIGIQKDT